MSVAASKRQSGLRVGSDLVEIAEIDASIARFGERYLARVFTPAEIEYCVASEPLRGSRFAARFAAKEATLKVLRPSGSWPAWRYIEVVRHSSGWCEIALHGPAAQLAVDQQVRVVSCSLSHEGAYANAVVLAIAGEPSILPLDSVDEKQNS